MPASNILELQWRMKDGTRISYQDMTLSHIDNVVNMIRRKKDELQGEFDAASCYSGNGDGAQYAAECAASSSFSQLQKVNEKLAIMLTVQDIRNSMTLNPHYEIPNWGQVSDMVDEKLMSIY